MEIQHVLFPHTPTYCLHGPCRPSSLKLRHEHPYQFKTWISPQQSRFCPSSIFALILPGFHVEFCTEHQAQWLLSEGSTNQLKRTWLPRPSFRQRNHIKIFLGVPLQGYFSIGTLNCHSSGLGVSDFVGKTSHQSTTMGLVWLPLKSLNGHILETPPISRGQSRHGINVVI